MQLPVQVENQGRIILGMLHIPQNRAEDSPLILLAYGLNGDRVDNHRLSIQLAQQANAVGISVLRFDYSGCGLSSSEFYETSISTKAADTLAMIEFLKGCFQEEPFKLVLLGYSDGVRVIHCVLQQCKDVFAICLWNPIIRSMTQTFRPGEKKKIVLEPMTRKCVIPLFGVYMSIDYLREANSDMDVRELLDLQIPKLFIFGTGDIHTLDFQTELKALAPVYSGLELREIAGANHLFNRIFWSDQLIEYTVDWVLKAAS